MRSHLHSELATAVRAYAARVNIVITSQTNAYAPHREGMITRYRQSLWCACGELKGVLDVRCRCCGRAGAPAEVSREYVPAWNGGFS